jgi:hypothetical protein
MFNNFSFIVWARIGATSSTIKCKPNLRACGLPDREKIAVSSKVPAIALEPQATQIRTSLSVSLHSLKERVLKSFPTPLHFFFYKRLDHFMGFISFCKTVTT